MDRRSLLKGLAVIPFVSVLASCEKDSDDRKHGATVEVHLDGAFALVIQENKGNALLAFSPRPKTGEDQHQFYFNGSHKAEDPGKTYHFKLSPQGLRREKRPEIDPGLNDFSFRTDKWRVGDSLVTIELPPPKRITFAGHRSPVTFAAGGRPAFMPTNHILEYEVEDPRRLKLECGSIGEACAAAVDSFPGVTRFFFEIGPKKTLDYELSHAHAIRFFNEILVGSFPELAEKYQLVVPQTGNRSAQVAPHVMPAVFQYSAHNSQLRNASYIIDCEFTGPLVGTNTAPMP